MSQFFWWRQIIGFLILVFFSYRLFSLVRGTALFSPLKFLSFLFLAGGVSNSLGLVELAFFWKIAILAYLVGAFVIFQPEMRRLYMNRTYHRGESVEGYFFQQSSDIRAQFIDNLTLACQSLSRKRVGALIVLERNNNLRDFIQTGILIDALFSSELIFSIFLTDSPLHDGAVILRENRAVAAGCILPLAEAAEVKKLVGTRHRAGLGITEQTDALAIIVSEETGKISLAVHGKMAWGVEIGALKKMLKILYRKE
ncbi:MAG: diadenylate cyclase [Candidatus Atribacteria bacterium]|nr:diadenylate cyclase [Candidatus Atribacteria bacterium]